MLQYFEACSPSIRRLIFRILCCTVIAGATAVAFFPSLHNGFTNWDDPHYVTDNPSIRGFSRDHVLTQFSWITTGNYHPLTMLTYMVDYAIFGLHPAGYHMTSLIFHIFNGLILFAFMVSLSKNDCVAFITAMFFAVHPLRVESVAWISEMKDVVSSFFLFPALWMYVRYVHNGQRRYYFACLLLFLLSLQAKPMAVTLPFVLLLIDRLADKNLKAGALVEKWPFFAVAVFFSALTYTTQLHCGALAMRTVLPPLQRVALPFFGALFYLYKTVVPVHLCAFYPYTCGGFPAHPYLYLVAAAITGAAAFLLARRSGKAVFGLLFYIVTSLPVLQMVPIGNAIAADRYSYLPTIGLYYLFALGCDRLLRGTVVKNRSMRSGFAVGLGLILSFLAFLTFKRCEVWKDSISLWSNAVSVYPSPLAYDNLGYELEKTGRTFEAADLYRRALAVDPDDPNAHCNLGNLLLAGGKTDEAIDQYRRATVNNPNFPDAHTNLGNILMACGKIDEAIAEYRTALKIDPNFIEALYNFGTALLQLGKTDEAMVNLQKVLELNPDRPDAHLNLGTALFNKGMVDEAIIQYRKALECRPNDAQALENLGIAYRRAGRTEEAIACFRNGRTK